MLFSVPFLQKIASPSYDVYSYVVLSAFMVNLLNLARVTRFKDVTKKKIGYTLLTIFFILFAKNNYVFALPSLFFLPLFTNKATEIYTRQRKGVRFAFWIFIMLAAVVVLYFLNQIFGLSNFF